MLLDRRRYFSKNCLAPAKHEVEAGELAKYLGNVNPIRKQQLTHSSW